MHKMIGNQSAVCAKHIAAAAPEHDEIALSPEMRALDDVLNLSPMITT